VTVDSGSFLYRNGARDVLKKHGSGKGNWGRAGDELDELGSYVNQPFVDDYGVNESSNDPNYSKIQVIFL
jgi:hypothetical protein